MVAGYGGGNVLQGVDLTCAAGSVTCIVGPNGAGKSTVLRVVSGLLPRPGAVLLDEERLAGWRPARSSRSAITQVPQSHALFPHDDGAGERADGRLPHPPGAEAAREALRAVEALIPIVAERAATRPATCPAGSGGWSRSPAA